MEQRFERSGGQRQWAVVIAVVAMREMQMAIDQIIHMVAVRHHFMPASGAVDVAGLVTCAAMLRGAGGGIGGAYGNHMLIDVPLVREVQVAIVQIIDMAIMANGGMAAVGTMLVGVIGVLGAGRHDIFLWSVNGGASDGRIQTDSAACPRILPTRSRTCASASE